MLHPAAELARLAREGRTLIVDEAFMDAVPEERESLVPLLTRLPGRTVVLRSLTKTWGLAGLRVGYVLGDPATVRALARQQPLWPVSAPALVAAQACTAPEALAEAQEAALRFAADRDRLRKRLAPLAGAGVREATPAPQGPFLLVRHPAPPRCATGCGSWASPCGAGGHLPRPRPGVVPGGGARPGDDRPVRGGAGAGAGDTGRRGHALSRPAPGTTEAGTTEGGTPCPPCCGTPAPCCGTTSSPSRWTTRGRTGERIEVFAREVAAADRRDEELPWLLFLQGGPGNGAPRPVGRADWLQVALRHYRVLLLDQRGTGRSSPANRQSLAARGTARQQAGHLAHFRADSIVRDAELIRKRLLGEDVPWSTLGQSFGGFCILTYLSLAPEGIREAFVTGGLPGLRTGPEDAYRAAYPRVAAKNAAHYARYPQDVAAVRRIAAHLAEHEVRLPDGSPLTVERFQYLGMLLGEGSGSHRLHYLLEDAWIGGTAGPELSDGFLEGVRAQVSLAANPLFAALHEPIWAQRSVSTGGTRWAAQRVRAEEFPEFDAGRALSGDGPVLLTGEMIYPWMFDLDPALVPLRARDGAAAGGAGRLAGPVRPAAAGPQRGAGVRGRLPRRHVRRPRRLAGHRARRGRGAHLGDRRVGARRAAGQRGRGAGAPGGDGPRRGVRRRPGRPARVPGGCLSGLRCGGPSATPAPRSPRRRGRGGAAGPPGGRRTASSIFSLISVRIRRTSASERARAACSRASCASLRSAREGGR